MAAPTNTTTSAGGASPSTATGGSPAASGTTASTTTPSNTDRQPTLSTDQGVILALIVVVGMVVIGLVIVLARKIVRGDDDAPGSVIRSWLAVSFVMGLLAFCAVAFAISDTSLRSTLFGGLVTSVGAAVAFYFSSQAADKAQAGIAAAMGAGGAPPTTFTNAAPPDARVGEAYSFLFSTDAATTPTYAITGGSAPDGLKLAVDGTLSGTPTAAGTYTFAVRASNGAGSLSREDFTVTVAS